MNTDNYHLPLSRNDDAAAAASRQRMTGGRTVIGGKLSASGWTNMKKRNRTRRQMMKHPTVANQINYIKKFGGMC